MTTTLHQSSAQPATLGLPTRHPSRRWLLWVLAAPLAPLTAAGLWWVDVHAGTVAACVLTFALPLSVLAARMPSRVRRAA